MCEPKCPLQKIHPCHLHSRRGDSERHEEVCLLLTVVHLMHGPLVRWCPLGSATGLHAKPESALRCVHRSFEEREEDDTGRYVVSTGVVSTGHSTWKTILHSIILCVTPAQSQAPISPMIHAEVLFREQVFGGCS